MRQFVYLLIMALSFSCSHKKTMNAPSSSSKIKPVKELTPENSGEYLKINAKKYMLENGLTVVLVQNKKIPVFSLQLFYKVGSKHEYPGITGSSHFLEHMMFKGAKKFGKGRFDKIIESNGGNSNAYTSFDLTVYHENLPKDALNLIIDVEADRMQNLLLEKVDFVREKYVVLEERKMRYENSPRGQLYTALMQEMFQGTPYGTPVIGSVQDIKSVTREQMYEYFKQFYVPNNAVLVISGDLEFDETIQQIQTSFGPIPSSEKLKLVKKERERADLFKVRDKIHTYKNYYGKSKNQMFKIAFKGWAYGTRNGYVGDLLSSVLTGGNSSYLYQKYVKSAKPLLLGIHSYNFTLQRNGLFYIGGELLNSTSRKYIYNLIRKDVKKYCKNISERDLTKVKNQYLLDFYHGLQTNHGVANYLGNMEFYLGDFTAYQKEIEIYQNVKLDEVIQLCEKVFDFNNAIYMTVWDKNKTRLKI